MRSEAAEHKTMWSIDPIITLYKPTEAVPLNPLQRVSMYLGTVSRISHVLFIHLPLGR